MGRVQPNLPLASEAVEGTLKAYIAAAGGSAHAKVLDELVQFAHSPARVFTILGTLGKASPKPAREYTIAFGPSFAAGGGGMLDVAFGLYFWNKPNIGVFGSFAGGYVSNFGASVTAQLYYLFGPAPDVLAGDCFMLGIDVGWGTGFSPTGSAFAVLSTKWEWIGVSFALGMGYSEFPVDITLQASTTVIKGVDL